MTARTERDHAFATFYEQHYPAVLAYVRRRTGEATARDVVAETFLVAWRRWDDASPGGLPWLYRTAGLTLRNSERSLRRAARVVDRLAAEPASQGAPDPAETVARRDQALEALSGLAEIDRELLLLVAWERLDVHAAAAVVGCSAATAAVRLHRARRRLAARLGADDTVDRPSPEVTP
jgi:RNA polymerase sigma-70 factor (ECF subfamily)